MPNRRGTPPSGLCSHVVLSALLAAGLCSSAPAALLAYEPFGYASGQDLVGQNGGSGWSGAWTQSGATVPDATITTPGLTYSGLASSGNRSGIDNTDNGSNTLMEVRRTFSTVTVGGTNDPLYISAWSMSTAPPAAPRKSSASPY